MTELRRLLDDAGAVADAVLYEGVVLYPYRRSAAKNVTRFQFGVVSPPGSAGERHQVTGQCIVDARPGARLVARLRFLRLQHRSVEERGVDGRYRPVDTLAVDGTLHTTWDEVVAEQVDAELALPAEGPAHVELPLHLEASRFVEVLGAGRVVRTSETLDARLVLTAEPDGGSLPLVRLSLAVAHDGPAAAVPATRDETLRRSLVGVHVVLAVDDASLLSMTDPPEFAAAAVGHCRQDGLWPALVGGSTRAPVMLFAPFVLPDDVRVAPGSPGDSCDATEIDEMLALRVFTLTADEQREARATDPMAAAIIDRWGALDTMELASLHATATGPSAGSDPTLEEAAHGPFQPGARVRLMPKRRADAQDIFLSGHTAVVEEVRRDVDGRAYVAVSLECDPASELHRWQGRFRYFDVDELRPVEGGG
jgi:hypothetical protein